MKKKSTGIGSSSILLIFVLLCLVSFATLSYVTAGADYKLSSTMLDRTTAYYEAKARAEVMLAGLDETLSQIYAGSEDADAYFNAVGRYKSFMIPISELQSLEVCLTLLYPENTGTPSIILIPFRSSSRESWIMRVI